MRLAPLAVLALVLAAAPRAQQVTSLSFATTQSLDGLYTADDGTLYAAEGSEGAKVYRVALDGTLAVAADGINGPIHMARADDGTLYVSNFYSGTVTQVAPNGDASPLATGLPAGPSDVVLDDDGTLYVTHFGVIGGPNGTDVTTITPQGTVGTLSSGGLLDAPVGIDFADDGTLSVANIFDGRIVTIESDGTQTLFASLPRVEPFSIGHIVWSQGKLYATYLGGHQVLAFEPDGTRRVLAGSGTPGRDDGPAATATFLQPNGLAASVTGDTLYVSEFIGPVDRIRMITGVLEATTADEPGALQGLWLDAAHPNPFHTSTTLDFELPAASDVQVVAYDMLGRTVGHLASGAHAAGRHSVAWAPERLAAGVYLLRLTAGAASTSRTVTYQP